MNVAKFLNGLTARFPPSSQRESAALKQLAYDLLDRVSPDREPCESALTILMMDLRDFSSLAAARSTSELVRLLSPFFTGMTQIIHEHGGFVDKFLGDGIMALFGAPEPSENHLLQAIQCAVRMQRAMREINAKHAEAGLPQVHAGIGIHSGRAMVGSFGPPEHREYTAIGDDVNFAARIEAFSLRGQILISEQCRSLAGDAIAVGEERVLHVKGRSGTVRLYEVTGIRRPRRLDVPAVELRRSPRIDVDLPLYYYVLHDGSRTATPEQGTILNLGYNGMLARLPAQRPLPSDIEFTVSSDLTSGDHCKLQARALKVVNDGDSYRSTFSFANINSPGHEAVRSYIDRLLWGR